MYHALVDANIIVRMRHKIDRQRAPPSDEILFWKPKHLTRRNQGLSRSRSAGTGGRESWEQGWARTFLNNEGVSNFAEMEDYNVESN